MKEMIQHATIGIPKGMKKMQFLFLLLLVLNFSSEMKISFSKNGKQKTV